MNKEEKLKSMIETIKARRDDEQYMGGPFPIYHIEFDLLIEEINRLNNIIDEIKNKDNVLEEFEKWLEEQKYRNSEWNNFVSDGARIGIPRQYIVDKLNELKGDNK